MAASSRKSNAKTKRRMGDGQIAQGLKATDAVNDNSVVRKKPVLSPKTPAQRFYIRTLVNGTEPIVIAHGPAGSGKTYLLCLDAISKLQAGTIKKVILARPTVTSGDEDYGYLPGTIVEKLAPWMAPIIDAFKEFYSPYEVEQMIKNEVIEIAPIGFMRGRTLKNAYIIGDEMQNATPAQLKMFMTRIGEGSRMFITGDIHQHDSPDGSVSGLTDLLRRLADREAQGHDVSRFAVHAFTKRDVVRHEVISDVLDLYEAA